MIYPILLPATTTAFAPVSRRSISLTFGMTLGLILIAGAGHGQNTDRRAAPKRWLVNISAGADVQYSKGWPAGIMLEREVSHRLSLGLQADYYTAAYPQFTYVIRHTLVPVALRASLHLNDWIRLGSPKADLYVGGLVGLLADNLSVTGPGGGLVDTASAYGGKILVGGYAGGRYAVTNRLGIFAELGYGILTARIGLSLRL